MEKLTDKTYWDGTYSRQKTKSTRQFDAFLNYSNRMVLGKLLETGIEGKKVLEIGAGDSLWLTHLAQRFTSSHFAGVDYSEKGCELLTARALQQNLDIDVVHEDMFVDHSLLHGVFDIAISFGVVEHFDDLSSVLKAKCRYLKPGGVMFTLIPNMAGVLGSLTKNWNRGVYDKHNPHDWTSFQKGHHQAGLEVMSGGYLGSSDFGVISSCFADRRGFARQVNRCLVAASVAGWLLESKSVPLPASKTFSPYIYAISRQAVGAHRAD
jgi:2-polyprenyl-3-methyl-5-hydroxy-6-metoxy-1,4-benzoquinol methylase